MTRRVLVELVDDIEGGRADETVAFGLDGRTYAIDLSARNADKLRQTLAAYVAAARRTGRGRSAPSTGAAPAGIDPKAVRAWAQSQGYAVNSRGRISAALIAAYQRAGG